MFLPFSSSTKKPKNLQVSVQRSFLHVKCSERYLFKLPWKKNWIWKKAAYCYTKMHCGISIASRFVQTFDPTQCLQIDDKVGYTFQEISWMFQANSRFFFRLESLPCLTRCRHVLKDQEANVVVELSMHCLIKLKSILRLVTVFLLFKRIAMVSCVLKEKHWFSHDKQVIERLHPWLHCLRLWNSLFGASFGMFFEQKKWRASHEFIVFVFF